MAVLRVSCAALALHLQSTGLPWAIASFCLSGQLRQQIESLVHCALELLDIHDLPTVVYSVGSTAHRPPLCGTRSHHSLPTYHQCIVPCLTTCWMQTTHVYV